MLEGGHTVHHEPKMVSKMSRPSRSSISQRLIWQANVIFFCLLGTMFASCSNATWYLDPGFAERKAEKDNRPLLYYFKAFDSTLHRNMYWNVLKSGSVKSELRDTINVELEYGFFDDREKRFGVKSPQSCVFVAPDGTQIGDTLNANPVPSPQAFLAWLRAAKAQWNGKQPTTRSSSDPTPPTDATGG